MPRNACAQCAPWIGTDDAGSDGGGTGVTGERIVPAAPERLSDSIQVRPQVVDDVADAGDGERDPDQPGGVAGPIHQVPEQAKLDPRATRTDAAALLARHPVDRTHRREALAARRKPLPTHRDPPLRQARLVPTGEST